MSAALAGALGQNGLVWLVAAVTLAGLVRGFFGFGSALVFMPVAALFVAPVRAITILLAMDLTGALALIPQAFREGDQGEVAHLAGGAAVGVPLGMALLFALPVTTFRWAVSLLTLAALAVLVGDWRYRGLVTRRVSAATGLLSGFLGGSTGLGGPPAILLNMASLRPAHVVRANMILFLACTDSIMLAVYVAVGRLEPAALALGAVLTAPFLLAVTAGGAIFRPGLEHIYRGRAYALIAGRPLPACRSGGDACA